MTEPARDREVLGTVSTLVDSLLDDFDVIDLLTELTNRCARLLDVASAGLLLADQRHHLHLMAATSERLEELELFQLQTDQGPCRDCFVTGEPVSVADLRTADERWPVFVPAAARAGFASVHAVPLRAAGTVLGSLGLFGDDVGELSDADLLIGQTLAHVATVAIVQGEAPTAGSLWSRQRSALTSRVVIEQAKGFVRGRMDVTIEVAFELLRTYAREQDLHLTDVARTLMSEPTERAGVLSALESIRQR